MDAALKAISISIIAGFVAFLLIGGMKSPYAVPIMIGAGVLFLVLWLIFVLTNCRTTQGTTIDEKPMAGDTNTWLSGRIRSDDTDGNSGDGGD